MEGEQRSPTVADSIRSMPGAVIAFTGFGIFLLAVEGTRLPAIQTVETAQGLYNLTSLVPLLLLVGLALLLRKRLDALKLRTVPILATGALMSAALFFIFRQGIFTEAPYVRAISGVLLTLCEGVLFFFWIKALYPCGPKLMAISFAFSLFVLAAISLLTTFFKTEAAHGVIMLLPTLSVGCLCYYRDYARAHASEAVEGESAGGVDRPEAGEHESTEKADGVGAPLLSSGDGTRKSYLVSALSLGLSLFCYAFIFGYIHFEWVLLQDGEFVSLAMQLGIAMGSACAGLFVLLLVRFLWSRVNLEIYKIFLIPTIILALWLSTFIDVVWIVFYLILLNITQKLVFFLIILAPCTIKGGPTVLWPWCIAYLAFAGGRAVSAATLTNVPMGISATLSVVALVVLFLSGVISTLRVGGTNRAGDDTPPDQKPAGPASTEAHRYRFQNACRALSDEYRLTQRESDILALLARGRTAQFIAESLVISPSTVKTHLRNIYSKMGVHNQQEVIDLTEKALQGQRQDVR